MKKGKRRKAAQAEAASSERRSVARNRRAAYDYEILERYEAGLVLTGTEIKALREGKASIAEAYVRPREGEIWLIGAHIAPYAAGSRFNHEPKRDRKLLLHRKQITQLSAAFDQRSLAIVPMHLYISRGLAKLAIGVGRGRRRHDKRDRMSERAAGREMREAVRR